MQQIKQLKQSNYFMIFKNRRFRGAPIFDGIGKNKMSKNQKSFGDLKKT
jgi:hypothetical protein